jgi:hypothetical protein
MTVLDLSKLFMYHYMSKNNMESGRPCTKFQTEDLYQDMTRNRKLFNTSNYPKNHILYSDTNKKVVGNMKDETGGI